MKVVYIDYVLDPNSPGKTGLSDLVWDMASRVAEHGIDTHVIGPYFTDEVPSTKVTLHRFPLPWIAYRNILGHFLIVLRAARVLRSIEFVDVVHVPEYFSSAVLSLLPLSNLPIVVTEPGNIFERVENGNPYDPFTTLIFKWAARRSSKRISRLIATSHLMWDWWKKTGVPASNLRLLPLGVDSEVFAPRKANGEVHHIHQDLFTILYVARISRENGLDVTLRAVASIHNRGLGVRLVIVGSGPAEKIMREYADELGIGGLVSWEGWVSYDILPEFYRAADLLVFSGFSGGTPRVVLQAMACGTPVVASAIGGIVDHVQEGVSGMLFTAGDHNELASKIVYLMDRGDIVNEMSGAAAVYARKEITWDVVIMKLLNIYEEITANR